MKYLNETRKPYPFCPGCTHGLILDAIDAALTKINADEKKVVLVSDIGCVGLSDKYFDVHTFHGLHGRSFTYACGIKMANPELLVFVLVGDGGCGIGGHHLINAARRNLGIKVICFNNFNFGMTGGEYSVTTPKGGKTHSSPEGSIERPFDLCKLVSSAGGTFVARKIAYDKDLGDTLARSFVHNGFSFIDVLEICTAYYMPLNDFKKSSITKLVEENKMEMGVLHEEKIDEYADTLRKISSQGGKIKVEPKGVEKKFEPSLKDGTFSVILAGSAGHKIVSAAATLARACITCGLFVSQQDDFPVTIQSGHSVSEVKISSSHVYYPGIDNPDFLLVTSIDGLKETAKTIKKLTKESTVIINSSLGALETKAKVVSVDFSDKALGLTKLNAMTAAVAMMLKIKDVIPLDAFRSIVDSISDKTIRRENVHAFETGVKLANGLRISNGPCKSSSPL